MGKLAPVETCESHATAQLCTMHYPCSSRAIRAFATFAIELNDSHMGPRKMCNISNMQCSLLNALTPQSEGVRHSRHTYDCKWMHNSSKTPVSQITTATHRLQGPRWSSTLASEREIVRQLKRIKWRLATIAMCAVLRWEKRSCGKSSCMRAAKPYYCSSTVSK